MGSPEEGEVNVTFSAQISEFVEKLGEATEAMKERFGSVTEVIGLMGEAFEWFTGLLAGGEAFEEAIKVTSELVDTTREFMDVTGEAADKAQAIMSAMKAAGGTTEQYEGTLRRLEMRLLTNTKAYDRYHIAYKDANGDLLNTDTVMHNVIERLDEMEAGSNRNRAAFELLGRGAGDVNTLMRAFEVDQQKIISLQSSLGLTVTDSMTKMREHYAETMVEAREVVEGLWNTIGTKLMPQLDKLGEWFVEQGPGLVGVMTEAVGLFGSVWHIVWSGIEEGVTDLLAIFGELADFIFEDLGPDGQPAQGAKWWIDFFKMLEKYVNDVKFGFEILGITVGGAIDEAINDFEMLASVIKHPIDSLRGLNKELDTLREKAKADREAMVSAMEDAANATLAANKAIDDRKVGGDTPGKPRSGTEAAPPKPDNSLANAQLAATRAALEAQANLEKEFNSEQLAELEETYKQGSVDTADYYQQKTRLEEEANDVSVRLKQAEMAETIKQRDTEQAGSAEWYKFQTKNLQLQGEINVLEAQRAEIAIRNGQALVDAEKKVNAALVQTRIDADEKANQDALTAETARIKQLQDLRIIDAQQALAMQTEAENRSYALTVQAMARKRDLIEGTADEVAQAQAKADADAEAAERAHQQKLGQIADQAALDRSKYMVQAFDTVQSSFTTLFESLAHNVNNAGQAFRAFGQAIVNMLINVGAQMASMWLMSQIKQQIFGVSSVLSNASIAATAAMASVAAIPYVGWAMAPGVGAETYATALAYMPSAEGGWWQVPSDTFANIHKDEMVMPAPLANDVRDMVEGGGGGGGGDVHIHAIPMPGGFWAMHETELVTTIKRAQQARRFG